MKIISAIDLWLVCLNDCVDGDVHGFDWRYTDSLKKTMMELFDNIPDFVFNTLMLSTPLLIFAAGTIGLIWYRFDMIRIFIALELQILATNMFFVQVSFFYTDVQLASQVMVPIVLAIAACEAAIGLGLLVVAYRVKGTIEFSAFNKLKG
jgi:NADH-quinone oxidoreductase subunit K